MRNSAEVVFRLTLGVTLDGGGGVNDLIDDGSGQTLHTSMKSRSSTGRRRVACEGGDCVRSAIAMTPFSCLCPPAKRQAVRIGPLPQGAIAQLIPCFEPLMRDSPPTLT